MSVYLRQTIASPGLALYGSGGGGGGGGGDLIASTITLEGSNAITATLASSPNDGFEVRNGGGGGNVVVVTTIDENNAAQAEMGIRTLSTIGSNVVPIGRFEMQADGVPTDLASLVYTLDKAASGTPSTIGRIDFKPGTAPNKGTVVIAAEDGTNFTVGDGNAFTGAGSSLQPTKAAALANSYVPAAGTTQTLASFSTIAGHTYELWLPNLRVQNQPASAPAAGAWCQLTVDTSNIAYCDTFDMASVFVIQNDLQKTPSYNFTASAAGHNLQATGSLSNTVSTAISINPAAVYLRDLGDSGSFVTVG